MKNVMKIGLALAMFMTAFAVRANDTDAYLSVRSGIGKLVNFTINNDKAQVAIYSANGEVIYSENLKAKDGRINRTYDLASFPTGTYYLEAETGTKVARYEIRINEKTAAVSQKAIAEVFKPVFSNKDGLVTVSIKNTEKTPVAIRLYDENNVELYNETFAAGAENVAKTFDTNKVSTNKFTFVTTYDNKMFVETIAAR